MAKRGGESNRGLIVTLVLSILLALIFAVTTYTNYTGWSDAEKKAKEEVDKAGARGKERDWYKAQAYTFRGLIDPTSVAADESKNLGEYRKAVDAAPGDAKDKEDVAKFMETMDKEFVWKAGQDRPGQTFRGKIQGLTTLANTNAENADKAAKDLASARRKAAEVKATDDAQIANLNKALADVKNDQSLDVATLNQQIADRDAALKTSNDQKQEVVNAREEEKKKFEKEIEGNKAAIRTLEGNVAKKEGELRVLLTASGDQGADYGQPKGKIVSMDRGGTRPFINLGSADGVRLPLTFSVFGLAADGRAAKEPKGRIEVTNILEAHLSQAQVTDLVDGNRDPILPGDLLFNPAWLPNQKTRVAVAGVMDLDGDGRDDLEDFLRSLKKQGYEVDVYLDPKEGKLVGKGMTRETDFLIVGPNHEAPSGVRRENDPRFKLADDLSAAKAALEKEATAIGVKVTRFKDFLSSTGYPQARSGATGANGSSNGVPPVRDLYRRY